MGLWGLLTYLLSLPDPPSEDHVWDLVAGWRAGSECNPTTPLSTLVRSCHSIFQTTTSVLGRLGLLCRPLALYYEVVKGLELSSLNSYIPQVSIALSIFFSICFSSIWGKYALNPKQRRGLEKKTKGGNSELDLINPYTLHKGPCRQEPSQ